MWPCGWVGVAALGLTSSFLSHLALLDLSWGAYFRKYSVSSPTLLAQLMTWVCIHVPPPENPSFALTGPRFRASAYPERTRPDPPPFCPVCAISASSSSAPSNQMCILATAICAWTLTWANPPRCRFGPNISRQRTNMVSEECRTKEVPTVIH